MKVLVCFALLAFAVVNAKHVRPQQQSSLDNQRGSFSSRMRSWSNALGVRSTETEFLNVCQPQVSKDINKEVQEILAVSTDILSQFEQAMEQDDKEDLIDIISKRKQILPKTVAAIQGTIFAALESKTKNYRSKQRRCASRANGELQMLIKQLKKIEEQTKEAASDLKQRTQIKQFEQMVETLKPLMVQVEQFVKDPSQKDQMSRPCKSAKLPTLMKTIVDSLKEMKPKLKKADEESKINAVESAAGLLTEANILNVICHAGENVNESDNVQEQVMMQDAKLVQKLTNQLESMSKDILVCCTSIFSRIFG